MKSPGLLNGIGIKANPKQISLRIRSGIGKRSSMFICPSKSFPKRVKIWFRKKWDFNVLLGNLFSAGGLFASVWGGVAGIVPWHLSATLFFMVGFQSYYCSRYYRLKHSRYSPKAGFEELHDFAEGLRRLSTTEHTKYIEKGQAGNLSDSELDRLIDEHRQFAYIMCRAVRNVLIGHGIKIQRVCLKLHVHDMLIRVANHDGMAPDRLATLHVGNQLFWKMLFNVHFHYEKWIHKEGVRSTTENARLITRPRFLAIDGLGEALHPKIMESLTSIVTRELPSASKDAPPPDENHKIAKEMWEQLRNAVDGRYNNCIGLTISGPAFVDPLAPVSPSPTHLVIGFIGMDSEHSDAIHLLEPSDLHGVAAIADAAYAPLTNLRTLFELRLRSLNKTASLNP